MAKNFRGGSSRGRKKTGSHIRDGRSVLKMDRRDRRRSFVDLI